ncbi:hypothetical protein AtubIFM54640_009204 [Aspergillus tubingensis]|nr:hypothetical protein AtubIFM54640_009204 [Aspergillus tubingensis]
MNDIGLTPEATGVQKQNKAGAMASASAKACGKLLTKYASGAVVNISLAAAEGFRVLPGLYGHKVHDYGQVMGWKTGTMAGAKSFASGIGSLGLVAYPGQGVKRTIQHATRNKRRKQVIGAYFGKRENGGFRMR